MVVQTSHGTKPPRSGFASPAGIALGPLDFARKGSWNIRWVRALVVVILLVVGVVVLFILFTAFKHSFSSVHQHSEEDVILYRIIVFLISTSQAEYSYLYCNS
jgi:hypothetical protein